MSNEWLVTIGGLVGSAITAIVGGIIALVNALHKNRLETRTTALDEQGKLIERLQKEIERHEAFITKQTQDIEELRDEHVACREESAELRGYLILLHDYARRTHTALTVAGVASEPPPDLPPSSQKREPSEFEQRTAAQQKVTLEALKPPMPPAGGTP